MSSEPADFQSSKRDRRDMMIMLDGIHRRVTVLEGTVASFINDLADLQRRAGHHASGQSTVTRVTPKQREALTYMAAHADMHLPPVVWQENGGFGGSVLPKLVEHGFVDRISGNRYRINATGLDYLSGEAS